MILFVSGAHGFHWVKSVAVFVSDWLLPADERLPNDSADHPVFHAASLLCTTGNIIIQNIALNVDKICSVLFS